MLCKQCGGSLNDNSRFCPACGAQVDTAQAAFQEPAAAGTVVLTKPDEAEPFRQAQPFQPDNNFYENGTEPVIPPPQPPASPKSKNTKLFILIGILLVGLIALAVGAVVVCSVFFTFSMQDVKDGHFAQYPDKTIGTLLDGAFENPQGAGNAPLWEENEKEDGSLVVTFDGKDADGGYFTLQFTHEKKQKHDEFSITAAMLDNAPLTQEQLDAYLARVLFPSAQQTTVADGTTTTPKVTTSLVTTTTTTATTTAFDVQTVYKDALEMHTTANHQTMLYYDYYSFDLNRDGYPELLVHTGECEADAKFTVYSYDGNTVTYCDEFGGSHASLYVEDEQLYLMWIHMGGEQIDRVWLSADKAVEFEEVYSAGQVIGDYYYVGTLLQPHSLTEIPGAPTQKQVYPADLIGKTVAEVYAALGEPDDADYDGANGPHGYLRYDSTYYIIRGGGGAIFWDGAPDRSARVSVIQIHNGAMMENVRVGMSRNDILPRVSLGAYEEDFVDGGYAAYKQIQKNGLSCSFVISCDTANDNAPCTELWLKATDLNEGALTIATAGVVTTANDALNMRSAPSTDAGITAQIPRGTRVTITGQGSSGSWYRVQLDNGSTGYVSAQYITVTASRERY